jgi:hypothetical protein
MRKFTKGQKVTKIEKHDWQCQQTQEIGTYGPKFGQIVTVNEYNPAHPYQDCCSFDEYPELDEYGDPNHFHQDCFAPVIEDSVLLEALENIKTPQEV